MKYRGYLKAKDGTQREIDLIERETPNGAMYMTLTAYAATTLGDLCPIIAENWCLMIDRDGAPAYRFSVQKADWVEV